MRVRGTDFAMFQGEPDMRALARDESLVFALVKATEGQGYCDPKWERNHLLAPSAFEFVTCYHVLRGTSDGRIQADHAGKQWDRMANVAARSTSHMLPAVIDFEITDKRAAQWLVDNACAYRQRIQEITGLTPILYSYPSFLRDQCADLAPAELVECWQWPALYVGKTWADVEAGFDPYEWLRSRKMLPKMWAAAPWALYQYDGDKGEYYKGVDYDFNVAQSRDVLRRMAGLVHDTEPHMPAVNAPIIEHTPTPRYDPLWERNEGEHTVRTEDVDLGD